MYDQRYDERFSFVLEDRPEKPRTEGITMVEGEAIHATGGLNYIEDLVSVNGAWIDWYKFVWSAFPLQPPSVMEKKIELLEENDVIPFTGGNFLEVGFARGLEDDLLDTLQEVGCPGVEVSSTVVDMSPERKADLIRKVTDMGFHVHGEVGRKLSERSGENLSLEAVIEEMNSCLDAGADIVIYEMEEIEELFTGDTDKISENESLDKLHRIIDEIGQQNLMFELPITGDFHDVTGMSAWFIKNLGPGVNLGNVNPTQVSLIEQQRHGIGPHQDPARGL